MRRRAGPVEGSNETRSSGCEHAYRVNAEVIYIPQDPRSAFCILDFGIRVISESGGLLRVPLPSGCQEGDYVSGEIRLESPLCTDAHPYNLNYTWRINRVSADTADFSDHPGDRGKSRYVDVSGTDVVKAGSYLLHSSIEPPEAWQT